jgi:hypothetical protein
MPPTVAGVCIAAASVASRSCRFASTLKRVTTPHSLPPLRRGGPQIPPGGAPTFARLLEWFETLGHLDNRAGNRMVFGNPFSTSGDGNAATHHEHSAEDVSNFASPDHAASRIREPSTGVRLLAGRNRVWLEEVLGNKTESRGISGAGARRSVCRLMRGLCVCWCVSHIEPRPRRAHAAFPPLSRVPLPLVVPGARRSGHFLVWPTLSCRVSSLFVPCQLHRSMKKATCCRHGSQTASHPAIPVSLCQVARGLTK